MVRPNELSFARRGALSKLADRARGARPGHLVGRLVGLDEDDDHRAIVAFGDAEVSVLSGPHKLVPGALVAVEVDSTNAPTRITGPVTTRPEGLDEDVPAPDAVTTMPELSWADKETLAQAVADLEDAQAELAKANTLLTTLGVAGDEAAITQALADYLDIPASEVTWSGNMYQTVLARLVVATGIVTETMIAKGAVTAEALNVVYTDPETGYGWRAEPEGLTFLDQDGNPSIVLRTDMANYFTIMREGAVVASISPHGDIAGRSVSAAENLRYKGEELSNLLEIPARGVIARSTNYGNETAIVGTSAARIAAVSLTTPATNRNIEIRFEGRLSQGTAERRILFNVRQSANPYVRPTNTSVKDWYKTAKGNDEIVLSFTTTTEELEWPYGTPISLGVFAESVSGETLTFHQSGRQQLTVTDLGPAINPQSHKPYVPASGGGTPTGTMDEHLWREQVSRKKASWVQTYRSDGTKYVYMSGGSDLAQRRAWQGYVQATSGVIGFPSMVAELSGATIKRVRLWIKNTETHLPEGATARISLHGYTAKPETHSWSTDVPIMEVPFIRGESQVIDIPAQYHAGVQSGLYRGVVLSASELGTQYVGGWDGENALWEIIYEK